MTIIRLPNLIIIFGKRKFESKTAWGKPLFSAFTPTQVYCFVTKDHTGRIIWFEKTCSDGYRILAR